MPHTVTIMRQHQRGCLPRIAQSGADPTAFARRAFLGMQVSDAHQRKAGQRGDERQRVERKAGRQANQGDERTAKHPREIEADRAEHNRGCQLLARDQLREQALARRVVEHRQAAEEQR